MRPESQSLSNISESSGPGSGIGGTARTTPSTAAWRKFRECRNAGLIYYIPLGNSFICSYKTQEDIKNVVFMKDLLRGV